MESEIAALSNVIKGLREDIKQDLQDSIGQLESKVSTSIQQMNEKIDEKFSCTISHVEELKQKLQLQENKINNLEKQSRIRNIVFFGVKEEENMMFSNCSYDFSSIIIIDIINNNMKIKYTNCDLQIVRRMGRKHKKNKAYTCHFYYLWEEITYYEKQKVIDEKEKHKIPKKDNDLNQIRKKRELEITPPS